MNTHVADVSEPVVLVPLFVAGLAVMLWRLNSGRRLTWPRAAAGVIACLYGVAVVREVFLPLSMANPDANRAPWYDFINLTPLVNTEFAADMIPNIFLFLPLGVLLPLLARVHSARRAMLIGLLLSLAIETTQLVTDVTLDAEHAADINDVLANTIGALTGYALLRVAVHLPPFARLAAALTWPGTSPTWQNNLDARTT